MDIDCHILTLAGDNPDWAQELRNDLDAEPVTQHWLPGIKGEFGAARAQGYARGNAPFVSFADPDDRIVAGTYAALLQALYDNPAAPFAWAGEQRVDANLQPQGLPSVWQDGYNPRRHRNHPSYVHGVVLYRRTVVEPALALLSQCGNGADWLMSAHAARLHMGLSRDQWPVHIPIVGRLWRQHSGGYHKQYTATDRNHAMRLMGITPQYLHIAKPPSTQPQTPNDCVGCGRPAPM